MKKNLTIIIPTYNMERYLDKCLSSLIVPIQMMERLDIIVVNDGSKDNSLKIAESYANRYPASISVIDKENGNYGSCINAALPKAIGQYVKVLDADDSLYTDSLAAFISFLDGIDVDLIINDFSKVNEDGEITDKISYNLPNGVFTLGEFQDGFEYKIAMHAFTYRTSILKDINYHQVEGVSYSDMQWIYCPMAKVKRVSYYGKYLYKYLVGRDGQTVDPTVYLKNYHMNIPVLENMVLCHEKFYSECDAVQKRYLDKLLLRRLSHLYNYYLLSTNKYLNQEQIRSFDKFLAENSSRVYSLSDSIELDNHGVKFKFVHEWRRNRSRNTVQFFLYDLYIRIKG